MRTVVVLLAVVASVFVATVTVAGMDREQAAAVTAAV